MVETLKRIIAPDDSSRYALASPQAGGGGGGEEVDENGDVVEGHLIRQAVKLMVHLLHTQAQWVGVPGVSRPPDAPESTLLPATSSSSSSDSSDSRGSLGLPDSVHSRRRPSWSHRFEAQKSSVENLAKAIRLAQTKSLRAALLSLPNSQPMELAKFMYEARLTTTRAQPACSTPTTSHPISSSVCVLRTKVPQR